MARDPQLVLPLVGRLLKHDLAAQLRVADAVIETKGLLATCLRPWTRMLDDRHGREPDDAVVEVLHALQAQALRLDNLEALSLALFVECFVGEKIEGPEGSSVTGGFVLYGGGGVRQVVLSLLRHWAEDEKELQALEPTSRYIPS